MAGECCRTKDMHYKTNFCKERVNIVTEMREGRKRDDERNLEAARNNMDESQRVRSFFKGYEKLCADHGLTLAHEDGHGSFILTNRDAIYNLGWAFSAIPKIDPETPEAKAERERRVHANKQYVDVSQMRNDMRLLEVELAGLKPGAATDPSPRSRKFQRGAVEFYLTHKDTFHAILAGQTPTFECPGDEDSAMVGTFTGRA